MKKIGILTSTRADYDLLLPVYRELIDSDLFDPVFIVTGTHLSENHGMTIDELKKEKVNILFSFSLSTENSTPEMLTISLAQMQMEYSRALRDNLVDGLIVLGDRVELLPIVLTTSLFGIPLIHMHGGEITQGAIDEVIRHAVTKFSLFHFPSTETYRKRIIQLGESPERVFNIGSVGVNNVKNINPLKISELEKELNLKLNEKTMVVTIHSETSQNKEYQIEMIQNFLSVVKEYSDWTIIFTGSNMDLYSDLIEKKIHNFVEKNENAFYFKSLGLKKYFSLLSYCSLCVGNTSSGIIEVPSFLIPTINIGDRQKGRVCASSVVHADISINSVKSAFVKATSKTFLESCREIQNPYEGNEPAKEMVRKLETLVWPDVLSKEFNDI
ncbi:UDP-N-acetylglucosamine 2-epimerase [Halobacteriovorax sp. HLS]|uniref:UDP-N-acetylglucosamine 2-epimerase n=1 Tax=Halobacteriovorax sp. HLS TaxID=2234000 RepID=UPI000FD9FA5A|nr:UDP-N-acetylglucosamine 2-epimerase [Halobacteriovorax sp. HLS]